MRLYDLVKDVGWDVPEVPVFNITNVVNYLDEHLDWGGPEEYEAQQAHAASSDVSEAICRDFEKIQDAFPPGFDFFLEHDCSGQDKDGSLWHVKKTEDGFNCEISTFTYDHEQAWVFVNDAPWAYNESKERIADVRCFRRKGFKSTAPDDLDPKTKPSVGFKLLLNSMGEPLPPYNYNTRFSDNRSMHQLGAWHLLPGLIAFMFLSMHSSSVRVVEQQSPRHERRQRVREGKTPLTVYKVIEIRPMRQSSCSSEPGGTSYSEHICRGHRMRFGPKYGKGLLFGKYAGVFWCPPALKGNRNIGTVKKDYIVSAPVNG